MSRHEAGSPSGPPEQGNGRPALAARGVDVRFGGLRALSDVTITLPQREISGLIGPNGAGKSTLFGVLTGFVRPLAGRVEFRGEDITRAAPHVRARMGVGRSFQQTELFGSLTIAEHLLLGLRMGQTNGRAFKGILSLQGWSRPGAPETDRVNALLSLLGLYDIADRPCATLPTGLARLVEVGRVLAMGTEVVLLDEPAAGLDDRETHDLDRALRLVMAEEDVSILIVEHDLEFVFGLCSSVTVLDAGSVIASGTPEDVRRDPAVQEAYLGAAHVDPR